MLVGLNVFEVVLKLVIHFFCASYSYSYRAKIFPIRSDQMMGLESIAELALLLEWMEISNQDHQSGMVITAQNCGGLVYLLKADVSVGQSDVLGEGKTYGIHQYFSL